MQSFLALEEHPHLGRRVEFLLNEARSKSPRDQAITYVMRVLSNYATVGKDMGSHDLKKVNRRVSARASEALLTAKTFREWTAITINEHPMPLKASWDWMRHEAEKLTVEKVWTHFVENPYVIVLRDEDRELTRRGLRSEKSGDDRYRIAGILITMLDHDPLDLWRKSQRH